MTFEQLQHAGLPSAYGALLTAVAAERPVELAAECTYVSVRPPDRHIGAFLNKKYVDVAVAPDRSAGAAVRFPGAEVRPRTTATHYVRVPLGADQAVLVEEVVAALDWRDGGHQWGGSVGAQQSSDVAGETCATCWTAIAVNGTCLCD